MTTSTARVEAIFQDARELQADALEMLALGKVRILAICPFPAHLNQSHGEIRRSMG